MTETTGDPGEETTKRVSWVELYFDLIFVFAVSQVAHEMVVVPTWLGMLAAFGLFTTLWWTWIGFAMLYNRRGDEQHLSHRVVIMVGTVPCAIAAIHAHDAFAGHPAAFAAALAATRLVLVAGYLLSMRQGDPRHAGQAAVGYTLSGLVFIVAALIHSEWSYALWLFPVGNEATFLMLRERGRAPSSDDSAPTGRRLRRLLAQLAPPRDPAYAVDAGHLAERFGLFMIILLGEIVITVGQAALNQPVDDAAHWLSLVSGLVLAASLWWLYFTSSADLYERILTASGGNPALAYTIYAGGHLVPAYTLLVVASGVALSLQDHTPAAACWMLTGGFAGYLFTTRAFTRPRQPWYARVLQRGGVVATVCLAFLQQVLIPAGVVTVVAGWALGAAALMTALRGTLTFPDRDQLLSLRSRSSV